MFHSLHIQLLRWKWGREQRTLRQRLVEKDDFPWSLEDDANKIPLRLIAGVDISFFSNEQDPNDQRACAAFVVFQRDRTGALEMVWEDLEFVHMDQPYIAGFLAFREVHFLRALLDRLRVQRPNLTPDVILVDGNGVLHPRGFGCASHFGVVCDMCVIGVAKNLHVIDGLDRNEVRNKMEIVGNGGHIPLVGVSGRTWGAALLPSPPQKVAPKNLVKDPKNPIFVSVGHRISLDSAVRVVNSLCVSRREPEPTRIADMRSREKVRQAKAFRHLYDVLSSINGEVQTVAEADISAFKQALKDTRQVVTDKELLKPANKVLATLEAGEKAGAKQLATFETVCKTALAALAPEMGPPPLIIRHTKRGLVLPATLAIGACVVIALLRRGRVS